MTRFTFALTMLFAVLAARSTTAQTKEIQDEVERKLAKARAAARTDEHVEIFRRLLNRGLVQTYHLAAADGSSVFSVNDLNECYYSLMDKGRQRLGDRQPNSLWIDYHFGSEKRGLPDLAEGVYLKGHGVLYTVTLPVPARNPLTWTEKPTEKPLTPWEREQRELRGEKAEPKAKADARPPSVSETILHLLAENGKHFTELTPDEQVTVAVVFRPGHLMTNQQCAACHATGGVGSKAALMEDPTKRAWKAVGIPDGGVVEPIKSAKDERKSPDESIVALFRNELALGDLHLRQGKPRDAEKVYRGLIDKCERLLMDLEKMPADSSSTERLYVIKIGMEVYAKLVQAQLETGDTAAVKKTFLSLEEFGRKVAKHAPTPKTGTAPPAPIPAKLTITATKKNLDLVGSGKMSFDEFRKAATIEYTGPEKDAKP